MQRRKGVPVGYKHHWSYRGRWNETKIAPGKWRVRFTATKRTSARGKGGPPPGFAVTWRFKNVIQRAVKRGPGEYDTILTGIKEHAGHSIRRKRKVFKHYTRGHKR